MAGLLPWGNAMTTDATLKDILNATKVIAIVGASANPLRASYFVARYLSQRGKTVIPINPGIAGQMLFGQTVRASLAEIPEHFAVDMVDIFRRSDQVLPVVEQALEHLPSLRTVWMQIGVENAEARQLAETRGVTVVENLCPKQEYQRLFGELRQGGFNTGIISSKL
jgi:predicted CoA-binding protein